MKETMKLLDSYYRDHLQRWCEAQFDAHHAFNVYARMMDYLLRHQDDAEFWINQGWPDLYNAMETERKDRQWLSENINKYGHCSQ